jgi:hypothetical protein
MPAACVVTIQCSNDAEASIDEETTIMRGDSEGSTFRALVKVRLDLVRKTEA